MSSFNHAASLFGVTGELAFFGHFTAMALWTGTLMMVGFYSRGPEGWGAFLKWFHPLAVVCVLMVIASGLFLMTGVTPDLVKSWILPYGQALLLKHILILPLLAFAFINGSLMKRRLIRDPQAKPAIWARTEALLLWLIYIVTGYMNQQPAPHAYTDSLAQSDAAATFRWFHPGYQGGAIGWEWSVPGMLLLLCGAGCLAGMILMFAKKNGAGKVLLLGLAAAASLYAGIMFSFA
ncbi:copper resistance D family protein [Paenibacillus sp. DMB20]|uniref:copper resistance D family protein n=1 Tax=Paenibacillus sp. DMB20 TaxID=1642570 RepID=UPI000AEC9885|nr:CopD family protein [Paenibacillus sp. DMB20]